LVKVSSAHGISSFITNTCRSCLEKLVEEEENSLASLKKFWSERLSEHLLAHLEVLNNTIRNPGRLDNLTTRVCRLLTRVPNFLLKHKELKSPKAKGKYSFVVPFCYAFTIMCVIMGESLESDDFLVRFLEFISLWYPAEKVDKVINLISQEKSVDSDAIDKIVFYFTNRKKSSFKHLRKWANNNIVFKNLFGFAKGCLQNSGMDDTYIFECICKIFRYL
jgi:hypothetical protein